MAATGTTERALLADLRELRAAPPADHRRSPSSDQRAKATGFVADQVERLQAVDRTPRSLAESLEPDGASSMTQLDLLTDPMADTAQEHVDRREVISAIRGLEGAAALVRRHGGDTLSAFKLRADLPRASPRTAAPCARPRRLGRFPVSRSVRGSWPAKPYRSGRT